ncbi:hypothetical protein DXC81_09525 [Collinsella tanakaei]|uniref:TraD/TraG TraM recognition site domain-containing protein n=1 Tax=Collinsella tanakaei TaxID=626935 RepID=A0A3E4QPN9_9ACTN|nr:type IV secretory system conjugative DNA transfer family protein [Collinsella tanakaei]RGL08160.1 hypothetical protein DXC81_09525 [Collinsella tanakaei]
MSGQKSFNVDEGAHLRSCLAWGALAGAAADAALAASWDPLCGWASTAASALPWDAAAALPLPTALALCSAACLAVGAANHVAWSRSLHDGTWVGGSRAPGAAVHGDARLVSSPRELRRLTSGWDAGKAPEGGTLVVGSLDGSLRLLDSVHSCVLAESGEGKSRRVIIPTAYANFLQGRSLVVNDVKGEIRAMLSPAMRAAGTHRIVDVMFDRPASSARFDPLHRPVAALAAEGPGGAVRELRELARCIVPRGERGDAFFTDGARNLFIGVALRMIEDPTIPAESKTVMSVSAAISPLGGKGAAERLDELVASCPPGDPALPFLGALNGERSGAPGIISTLSTYLAEYVDDNVARMLHDDEIGLDRLGEEPTVVFLSSSSASGDYRRLVQTFVAQALSALRTCAAAHAGRCPVETVLLLDEAASLGRNERLVQDLGEMRSERIHVTWVCQSLLQMQSVSGYSREEAETILDLLKDKVVLSCSNPDTARNLSESMGSYTARARSTSRTRGASSDSSGTSDSLVRRPLISPDELMRWTGRETGSLVIRGGVPLALPSRDITETFLGPELGMTSPEAERRLMEAALTGLEERNRSAPPVWRGPSAPGAGQPPKKRIATPGDLGLTTARVALYGAKGARNPPRKRPPSGETAHA